MPTSYIRVGIHFVWATWDREPTIIAAWEKQLFASISAKCEELNCALYAVNGMADHLHVLLRLPATITIADVAKHLKGASSHLINTEFAPVETFRWQGAYAAFAVGSDGIDRVRSYILNQKQHHANGTTLPDWEQTEEPDAPE